ncbi:unnamed protein product, partial [Musa textilis]
SKVRNTIPYRCTESCSVRYGTGVPSGTVGVLLPPDISPYRSIREIPGVPPGRGRSAYRYPIGPVRTARTRRYSSKLHTLD